MGFGKVPTRELNKKSIYLLDILFVIQILLILGFGKVATRE
jgi:hypothetical protein